MTTIETAWPYGRASALIVASQEWSPPGRDALAASLLVTVGGEAGTEPLVHLFGSMIGSEAERFSNPSGTWQKRTCASV